MTEPDARPWPGNAALPEGFATEQHRKLAMDAVSELLSFVDPEPAREGLRGTPRRVVDALTEMTSGYRADIGALLGVTFPGEGYDEMVVVRGLPYASLCEHHLLPFTGRVTIGYIPGKRVVGLSKLGRLVDAYARRLQIQERMTREILDALVAHLAPRGAAVCVYGEHSCMSCRGIKKAGTMVTSALAGVMLVDEAAREEFMGLAKE